ncbi:MAG: alkaline phosphatase family protein [Acetobacteraceae bacterium]
MPLSSAAPNVGKGERLLLVGWPSAEWSVLHRLLDAGSLPFLGRLIERGCSGSLAATLPFDPAALWTTLATGLLPDRHGVTSGQEVRPDGGGVQPVGRRSWRAEAFWETLEREGLRTACVAWPGTAPADRWPGWHVDEDFARPSGADFATWAMPAHAVAPAVLRPELAGLRVHPADDPGRFLRALLPRANEAPPDDHRPVALAQALAQTATVHAVATHFAAARPDVLCVCYGLLGQVKAATTPEDERPDSVFSGLGERVQRFLDLMLGRLIELAGDGATIMVVSPDGGLPAYRLHQPAAPRGLLVAAGPGIASDTAFPGGSVADVAPTILARFGFVTPTDGHPIARLIPLGAERRHAEPEAIPAREIEADPALALMALGYQDRITPEQALVIERTEVARLLNLAEAQMTRGTHEAAATTLEALLRRQPRHIAGLQRLAQCRALLGDPEACQPIGQALLEIDPSQPWGHLVLGVWCVLTADHAAADAHLARARELGAAIPQVLARLGGIELLRYRHEAAAALFNEALLIEPMLTEALYGLGAAHANLADWAAAEDALRRAIQLQYFQPRAHLLLGRAVGAQGRWRDAVATLETALAQQPGLPEAASLLDRARQALAEALIAEAALR